MKAFFFFPINVETFPDSGIIKKNNHIVSSIRELGVEADVVTFSYQGIHFNDSLIKKITNTKLIRGLNNYIFVYNAVAKNVDFREYDFLWIRTPYCQPQFIRFLKNIKRDNPRTKIILEYGAFPFKDELNKYQRIFYPLIEYCSKFLKKYVSFVITYHGQDEIYGIPNIKIGNGIDTDAVSWNHRVRPLDNALHLISVSSLLRWHAYDRVIEGLKNYYQNESGKNDIDVIFHIVGNGPEENLLREMTVKAGLEDKVIFHGFKTGEELNKLFAQSHVAVGSLGHSRINLEMSNTLKSREYFSRGMPFVLAAKDVDFPEELPFIKYVPSNESPVDISSIVEFYKNIINEHPSYPHLIRKYAETNLTWKSKLAQVLEAVNGN